MTEGSQRLALLGNALPFVRSVEILRFEDFAQDDIDGGSAPCVGQHLVCVNRQVTSVRKAVGQDLTEHQIIGAARLKCHPERVLESRDLLVFFLVGT